GKVRRAEDRLDDRADPRRDVAARELLTMRARLFSTFVAIAAVAGCGGLLGLRDGSVAQSCSGDRDCPPDERCIASNSAANSMGSAYICFPIIHCGSDMDCAGLPAVACAPDNTCRTHCPYTSTVKGSLATCASDQ